MGAHNVRHNKPVTMLDAKGGTGVDVTTGFNIEDFKAAVVSFATDGGADANLTVKFQGSIQETAPDFSAAQTVTNMWDFVEVIDLQTGNPVNGDTGVAVGGADDYRQFEFNVNALKWINARVTARSEGEVTVKLLAFDNS